MEIVYVVTQGEYSDYRIRAIFEHRDEACRYRDKLRGGDMWESCEVEEYELGEPKKRLRRWYQSEICIKDGLITEFPVTVEECEFISQAIDKSYNGTLRFRSSISQGHATKCVIEYRQEWLRTHQLQDR